MTDKIQTAAARGDREFLIALRDHLAATLDSDPPPHTIAALTKQILDVRRELALLDPLPDDDSIAAAVATPDAQFDPGSV